jgi:diguanylate cyclase (GGDEF)-like protein
MGRRIAGTLAFCAVLPLLAFAAAVIWQPTRALILLPAALLLAAGCVLGAARQIEHRHLLPLASLRAGLETLLQRRFEMPQVIGADEPRALLVSLGRCIASLEQQLRALETLSEIDRQLLGSTRLEQVLDTILSRVQAIIRCHSVGIALRDADARGRGRVYLTAADHADLPVSRVALDEDMLATLCGETGGLTIVRCEDARHSFLTPLKATGAEIFWVWPVIVAERVEAILAVGFRELPLADPHVIRCGADFAARLATALSKSARDEHLYRQAHYDPLTALPNRLLFRDRLAKELGGPAGDGARGALLYIDLDHFKGVNDSFGHDAGDQLLTVVAQRLRASIKDGDTVARLGGDEFTVILRNVTDTEAARVVAERIAESLRLPVRIGGRDHHVGASIGITLFPDDGAGFDDVVRNADTAMYRAKDLGRGRIMFFERSMTVKLQVPSDSGLQRALRKREFSLFYQPQFAVANGALAGVEALLRWQTPRDGVRQPEEFVPAAEESGLMIDIGGWVLDAACAQLAVWREQGIAPPRLSVNVSAQQLRHPDFTRSVRRALDRYALPGDLLELELTESVFADETAAATLLPLAQAGVRLALDDFGTGYSSLSYLRRYPISVVKIDRAFLGEVPHNAASATLVETIIVMAHALGKHVVAEGIETGAQLDFLRERRCDLAQGFYLARPLAAPAITELLLAQSGVLAPELRALG